MEKTVVEMAVIRREGSSWGIYYIFKPQMQKKMEILHSILHF